MAIPSNSIFNLNPGRHPDGSGLYLYVGKSGRRSWQLRFKTGGKYVFRAIGTLPAMGLAAARSKARQVQAEAALGVLGTGDSKVQGVVVSTGGITVADTWARYADSMLGSGVWTNEHHKRTGLQMRKHLGNLALWNEPASDLDRTVVVAACEGIKSREMRQRCFRWWRAAHEEALNAGVVANNIMPRALPKTLARPASDKGTLAGNISLLRAKEVLAASWYSEAALSVRAAHRVCALSGHRIGAVLAARVSDYDPATGVWTVPRANMKTDGPGHRHDVVIDCATELAQALTQVHERATATRAVWLFPNATSEAPVLNESVIRHIKRLLQPNEQFTPHGWRSLLLTWALDTGHSREVAQAALDHSRGTESDRAYDGSTLRAQVSELLAAWGKVLA